MLGGDAFVFAIFQTTCAQLYYVFGVVCVCYRYEQFIEFSNFPY